jgi:hypothetical protein
MTGFCKKNSTYVSIKSLFRQNDTVIRYHITIIYVVSKREESEKSQGKGIKSQCNVSGLRKGIDRVTPLQGFFEGDVSYRSPSGFKIR